MKAAQYKYNFESEELPEFDFSAVTVRGSKVEGRGTYAARDIVLGEVVAPLTGRLVSSSVAEAPEYDRMALQIDDNWWLEEMGFPDDFINHSCEPNLRFTKDGRGFEALCNIRKGEELFFDYATSLYDGGWSVKCLCRKQGCRGFITGFVDLDINIQSRLIDNSLPYIQKKHE